MKNIFPLVALLGTLQASSFSLHASTSEVKKLSDALQAKLAYYSHQDQLSYQKLKAILDETFDLQTYEQYVKISFSLQKTVSLYEDTSRWQQQYPKIQELSIHKTLLEILLGKPADLENLDRLKYADFYHGFELMSHAARYSILEKLCQKPYLFQPSARSFLIDIFAQLGHSEEALDLFKYPIPQVNQDLVFIVKQYLDDKSAQKYLEYHWKKIQPSASPLALKVYAQVSKGQKIQEPYVSFFISHKNDILVIEGLLEGEHYSLFQEILVKSNIPAEQKTFLKIKADLAQGSFNEALQSFNKIENIYHIEILSLKAHLLKSIGDYQEALDTLKICFLINDEDQDLMRLKIETLLQTNPEEALWYIQDLMETSDVNTQLFYYQAIALVKLQRQQEALELLKMLYVIEPSNPLVASQLLTVMLQSPTEPKELALLAKDLDQQDRHYYPEVMLAKAKFLLHIGQKEQAAQLAVEIGHRYPTKEILEHTISLLKTMGRKDLVKTTIDHILEKYPKHQRDNIKKQAQFI